MASTMSETVLKDGRILPSASQDNGDKMMRGQAENEGVEVVLGGDKMGDSMMGTSPRASQDQNVFRPPRPVRPRAVRAQGAAGAPSSHVPSTGSFGGYGHRHPAADYAHRSPYAVPYNPSGSFDDGYHSQSHQSHQSHYSPHANYPHPGSQADAVNVISPSHKPGATTSPTRPPSHHARQHYQYPPASPVSRPEAPVTSASSPPRLRRYGMPPREGPYSAAQRGAAHPAGPSAGRPEDEHHQYQYPPPPPPNGPRGGPPVVADSFDSDHYSAHHSHASHPSHPTTPDVPHYAPPRSDYRAPPQYSGSSFGTGSFDSHGPSRYDDYRYSGYSPHRQPESPYPRYPSSYSAYSPGGYYDSYQSPYPEYNRSMTRGPHGYDDMGRHGYGSKAISPEKASNGMLLPAAAHEIDFEVTDPPMEPVTPPSLKPVCDSPGNVNAFDVLLGRGGGTNSQIGNRRFRKLVQEFQPTYLMARRKEKPLLARTIVLIIRKRGGRFLKKNDESGHLYEVGDAKAEAKTSQALREGLDVRATRSATNADKKKKKKAKNPDGSDKAPDTPAGASTTTSAADTPGTAASAGDSPGAHMKMDDEDDHDDDNNSTANRREGSMLNSPPILPKLQGEKPAEHKTATRPGSPDNMHFRKRRRVRSGDGSRTVMGSLHDKLFSEFCPPRADLARAPSPIADDSSVVKTPERPRAAAEKQNDDEDAAFQAAQCNTAGGCAGIALDVVTGAASGSFFLGPRKWKSEQ